MGHRYAHPARRVRTTRMLPKGEGVGCGEGVRTAGVAACVGVNHAPNYTRRKETQWHRHVGRQRDT